MLLWQWDLLLICPLLWQTSIATDSIEIPPEFVQPPKITKQSPKIHYVDPREDIIITCEAKGNPKPTYQWKKDGKDFNVSAEPGVIMENNVGTLKFSILEVDNVTALESEFQCIISNANGTAVSEKINLRMATIPKWPKEVVEPMEEKEGKSLILHCNPPYGVPQPRIYWMNKDMKQIQQDDRVSQGINGDLYFSNLKLSDSRDDYTCIAELRITRTLIQKQPINLRVTPAEMVNETDSDNLSKTKVGGWAHKNRPPLLLSPEGKGKFSAKVALHGQDLLFECIADGLPTPKITWHKESHPLPRERMFLVNYNKTLRISPVKLRDVGQYECTASNDYGKQKHIFNLMVEAAPFLSEPIQDKQVSPHQQAVLYCPANGHPKPDISWMINGIPFKDAPDDNTRKVKTPEAVFLKKVKVGGSAVYQCVAKNIRGSFIANIILHVLSVSPRMMTPNNTIYNVVESQSVSMDCSVFGSPKPRLIWTQSNITRRSFEVSKNGSIRIPLAKKADEGEYICNATNDLGQNITKALLLVKDATRILKLENLRVPRLGTASFWCDVSHDPELEVTIFWGQGRPDLNWNDRVTFLNNTLLISNVTIEDEGKYICTAKSELDVVTQEANLTVIDRPDPPLMLLYSDKKATSVKLRWIPGNDHNSPITEYVVQFEEDDHFPGMWRTLAKLPGTMTKKELKLKPNVNYKFRVLAANEAGHSAPSDSPPRFRPNATVPDVYPLYLKAAGTEPSNMVISWQKMDPLDQNGPDMQYHVLWRPQDSSEPWSEANVDPNESHVVVNDTPTFTSFEVKVQAVNELGEGPMSEPIIGYSGEDVPLSFPKDFRYTVENSTQVMLQWRPVPVEELRGHLKGYLVSYQKMKEHPGRQRRHAKKEVFRFPPTQASGVLPGLKPYSTYKMDIRVVNGKGEGPPSDPSINVHMPEGPPGPVKYLWVANHNLTSVLLQWKPPKHLNGILRGYKVAYQSINDSEPLGPRQAFEVSEEIWLATDLEPYTKYKFYVAAYNNAGASKDATEESVTIEEVAVKILPGLGSAARVPAPPVLQFDNNTAGDTFLNISWVPGRGPSPEKIMIQYQNKNGAGEWKNSSEMSAEHTFVVLDNLQPSTTYKVRMLTINDHGHATSNENVITTSGVNSSQRSESAAMQVWWIVLMCIIALLILILLIICFIKRNKGGKYSVKDKEEARADPEAKPTKDETFGEYSDNDEKPLQSSLPSLDGSVRKEPSDDSLAEYGDGVEGMFNEDGSFIGQYRGSKERVSTEGFVGSEATSPVGPQNAFV
uniref:neuronal cell adhesion molecule-like isoform X2 n=1 Tax=Myxine glutinosa TaxID=7769 RepID=UPI00358F57EF